MKVVELTGAALDWAVAECEGYVCRGACKADRWHVFIPRPDGGGQLYQPSADWGQGGPIIEREKISTDFDWDGWVASMSDGTCYFDQNLLVVAMRCYVASKLGSDIDIPKALA